ncbi:putative bifunctional diguanylate cyclase/phosphodiesterase [Melissospora conviva]|uniref:putative bifunctional diguanylate cyclase/phosphodiesterase n=1 Tax=Melissospora conviva TaxID=3388432 RepID=UPI003C173947
MSLPGAAPGGSLLRAAAPAPGRGLRSWTALALCAAVIVGELLWFLLDLPRRALVSDAAATVVAGIAAAYCLRVARRHPSALRTFWRLLAVTMALAAAGRAIWTVARLTGDGLPHTPLIATIFIAGICAGTGALLSFLSAPDSAIGRTRILLDGVIVALALVPISWLIALRDVTGSSLADPLRSLALVYPMLDLVQLTVLVAISSGSRVRWPALSLIGASLAVRALADTVYVSLNVRDDYVAGHLIDVCWPLSYLLIAVATRYPAPVRLDDADDNVERLLAARWRTAVPYLLVGGSIVATLVARQVAVRSPAIVFWSSLGLLAALAIRQGLVARENRQLAARMRGLAHQDPLTGLPNRLAFNRELQRHVRHRRPVTVLLLDLDGFKQVNDRFGHATGDQLLTAVAERMRHALDGEGVLARVGGDEFAVLVDGVREHDPELIARRLLAALGPAGPDDDIAGHCTASIGIAAYGPQHSGQADLLRDADIAMYAAKEAGKSAYRVCTPALRRQAVSRAELIADLRRALAEGGQLELAYQPIVAVGTGAMSGAEALVRWRHPRHGLLGPDRFLPLAEEIGLIVAVDRWVLREACRAAAGWQELAPGLTVAVNISPANLRRPGLAADVAEVVRDTGLAPAALTLELTETALIDGTETVLERLRQLRAIGVRIAIDDFGTGYSSLSYLHRIPATELKIDQSFVARLGGADPQAYATVAMVSKLAAAFDLVVVAEGVETEEQHRAVAEIGCPHGQGYRYGRPATLAQLRSSLRTAQASA